MLEGIPQDQFGSLKGGNSPFSQGSGLLDFLIGNTKRNKNKISQKEKTYLMVHIQMIEHSEGQTWTHTTNTIIYPRFKLWQWTKVPCCYQGTGFFHATGMFLTCFHNMSMLWIRLLIFCVETIA